MQGQEHTDPEHNVTHPEHAQTHRVEVKETHIQEHEHPEVSHPLGESHEHFSGQERRTIAFLTLCLIAAVISVPIIAGMSMSPIPNVLLGLSPIIVMIIIDLLLARGHFKRSLFWGSLLITHFLGLVWIHLGNFLLESQVNVAQAVAVNVIFAIPVTILAWLIDGGAHMEVRERRTTPMEFTPEALPQFVSAIEDKAKALNFAIGRVYRNSNGGTAKLRERLRIPRDWYNEFTSADEKERHERAKVLVQKIHDRLLLYKKSENELFSKEEVQKIKNLHRHKGGETMVLDVLMANDTDPVQHTYQSAVETCEQILEGLK